MGLRRQSAQRSRLLRDWKMKRILLTLVLLVVWSQMPGALEIRTPKGSVKLAEHSFSGSQWVCAKELAAKLHGIYERDPVSDYPVLTVNGKRVLFSTTSGVASVDGKLVRFAKIPFERDGCLWLPVKALTPVLGAVFRGGVVVMGRASPAERARAALGAATFKRGFGVKGKVAVSYDAVRLTLRGKAAKKATVKREGEKVVISLLKGRFTMASRKLGEGIVRSIDVVNGGGKIVVSLGAGFERFVSIRLRNPDRVVIIFKGTGQKLPGEQALQGEPGGTQPVNSAGTSMGLAPVKTSAFDVVVLDPGHGGADSGAISKDGLQEKVITLAIAKKLQVELEKTGLAVILTRNGDTTVPLRQRTAIANYNRADLFLSIHVNASPNPSARGAETYCMSRKATDLWSQQLADKENAPRGVIKEEGNGLHLVLWNLAQTAYIVESSVFAEEVQNEFNTLLGTKDRGVKQAPFVVLEGAQMPAVLVEVGFLSNPGEEKKLREPAFQQKVADALDRAILTFKTRYEHPDAASR